MRNPRLLITAIALLLLGLVVNHFMQRPPAPQFAPDLQGA
ncbi:ribonuclease, partial [Stenotrophomonas maltophilia]